VLSGLYKLCDQDVFVRVKETSASFILQLIPCPRRFLDPPLDDFFKQEKSTIKKSGSKHAIQIWSDGDFTLYPFRVGVPFVFSPCADKKN